MLTDPGDLVVDPFAGSCVTGEDCEKLRRRWICIDLVDEYLRGGLGRFEREPESPSDQRPVTERSGFYDDDAHYFRVWRPGLFWNGIEGRRLLKDGGRKRRIDSAVKRTVTRQPRPSR